MARRTIQLRDTAASQGPYFACGQMWDLSHADVTVWIHDEGTEGYFPAAHNQPESRFPVSEHTFYEQMREEQVVPFSEKGPEYFIEVKATIKLPLSTVHAILPLKTS